MPQQKRRGGNVVPKTYYRNVSWLECLALPIVWVLIPLAGYFPEWLEWIPNQWYKTLVYYQTWFALVFKIVCGVHFLEMMYTLKLCQEMNLTLFTTFKWLINVAFNGICALRRLTFPERSKGHNQ